MASVPFEPPVREDLIAGMHRMTGIAATAPGRLPVADMASQALASVSPRSLFRKTALVACAEGVISGRDLVIESPKLADMVARMDRPEGIYAFALTLGESFDRLLAGMQRISLAKALLLDAAGTVLVEHYALLIEEYLRTRSQRQGLENSGRFSPGYCDWDARQGQAELGRFIMPQAIGIAMHASGAMLPVKSVTGILITAADIPARFPCVWCPKASCRNRR